ncbi:AAA family ATPase [Methylomonas montana]|uniref:AAA family ATPase n=1 Tax=Methylomonas montana TaxID=3058963 RepID=UPI0026586CBA|nr:AAA family ATPase [Methylomonas montana]WKJ91331.1 AAA family ATPase [Methylomonas montana]
MTLKKISNDPNKHTTTKSTSRILSDTSQTDSNQSKLIKAEVDPSSADYREIYTKLFGPTPAESMATDSHAYLDTEDSPEPTVKTITLFDHDLAKELSERISIGREEKKFYSSLRPEHSQKPIIEPSDAVFERIQQLFFDYPNAIDLLKYVHDFLCLRNISRNKAIYMSPILIAGDPGIGKTAVIRAICKALGVDYGFYDFSSASSSWGLCGQDSGWNGSHIGIVLKKLLYGACANPIVHLDELDKGMVNHNLDPYLALHTLLERPQMIGYQDAYAQNLPVNASHVMFLATANDISAIPRPIQSRFRILEISTPSPSQMRRIVANMYSSKLHEEGVEGVFAIQLAERVIDFLVHKTPREVGLILSRAIAAASGRKPVPGGQYEIQLQDLSDCLPQEISQQRKVGFVW